MTKTNHGTSAVVLYLTISLLAILILVATLPSLAGNTEAPPSPVDVQPLRATPTPMLGETVPGSAAPKLSTVTASSTPAATPTPGPATATAVAIFSTVAAQPPPGPTAELRLVFDEEFNGNALDGAKWSTCYPWFDPATGCTNEGNPELQWYLPQAVTVANGAATLRADLQPYKGTDGQTYAYTSGMIATGGSPSVTPGFVFQYGYAEARLKIPAGRGVWPTFWLASADGAWPPEVDIAERVGGTSTDKIAMAVHYPLPQGGHAFSFDEFVGPDFRADWHVFGLEWTPNSLIWYIDGVERWRYTQASNIPHQPMYLIISLAIHGGVAPDSTVPFPQTLAIDYVRVWQP